MRYFHHSGSYARIFPYVVLFYQSNVKGSWKNIRKVSWNLQEIQNIQSIESLSDDWHVWLVYDYTSKLVCNMNAFNIYWLVFDIVDTAAMHIKLRPPRLSSCDVSRLIREGQQVQRCAEIDLITHTKQSCLWGFLYWIAAIFILKIFLFCVCI